MAEVGLFAMKRDQINRAILPLTVAGIEVDIVQMGPIALYNFITLRPAQGDAGSKDSVVLLDIGADNTDLIITDGTRIWQRNVPIGGNHFTRALTKELKLTFAKAEHLKRNATKAPDPRPIFTAMRGVFNDFASEVNRSIGFYSSVNRTAKIAKVVGLGNGFKLPGLQKFLQQNLSHEVEKLEAFAKLAGDEVKAAPAVPGQPAVVRRRLRPGRAGAGQERPADEPAAAGDRAGPADPRKKPWALAASALLMLGFSALFISATTGCWPRSSTPQFKAAVEQAKDGHASGRRVSRPPTTTAKGEWTGKFDEGKALSSTRPNRGDVAGVPQDDQRLLPRPGRRVQARPGQAGQPGQLEKLRVHIDAIKPVWRTDVAASGSTPLDPTLQAADAPLRRGQSARRRGLDRPDRRPPLQPVPLRRAVQADPDERPEADGVRALSVHHPEDPPQAQRSPNLRLYGVDHVALAWMNSDKDWTSEKGSMTNNLASQHRPAARSGPRRRPAEGRGGAEWKAMMGMMVPAA